MGTAIAWPLYVALADAIVNDATIAASLAGDRVYNTLAPANSPLDYVVLAGPTENELWFFGTGGSNASTFIHAYCRGIDNRRALILYGELHRVLNRATLVVDGFASFSGELRLIDAQPDSDGESTHLVARYDVVGVRA